MRRISFNVRGRSPRPDWRGAALLFVVLGAALALWFEVLLPRVAKPAQPLSDSTEKLAAELANIKMLGRALTLHAAEHDGKFPPAISEIHWRQNLPGMGWSGLPAAVSRFHHPDSGRTSEWLYYPVRTEADPPEAILVASPVPVGPHRDQRLVVRVNNVAEIIPEREFEQATATPTPVPPVPPSPSTLVPSTSSPSLPSTPWPTASASPL